MLVYYEIGKGIRKYLILHFFGDGCSKYFWQHRGNVPAGPRHHLKKNYSSVNKYSFYLSFYCTCSALLKYTWVQWELDFRKLKLKFSIEHNKEVNFPKFLGETCFLEGCNRLQPGHCTPAEIAMYS